MLFAICFIFVLEQTQLRNSVNMCELNQTRVLYSKNILCIISVKHVMCYNELMIDVFQFSFLENKMVFQWHLVGNRSEKDFESEKSRGNSSEWTFKNPPR